MYILHLALKTTFNNEVSDSKSADPHISSNPHKNQQDFTRRPTNNNQSTASEYNDKTFIIMVTIIMCFNGRIANSGNSDSLFIYPESTVSPSQLLKYRTSFPPQLQKICASGLPHGAVSQSAESVSTTVVQLCVPCSQAT